MLPGCVAGLGTSSVTSNSNSDFVVHTNTSPALPAQGISLHCFLVIHGYDFQVYVVLTTMHPNVNPYRRSEVLERQERGRQRL